MIKLYPVSLHENGLTSLVGLFDTREEADEFITYYNENGLRKLSRSSIPVEVNALRPILEHMKNGRERFEIRMYRDGAVRDADRVFGLKDNEHHIYVSSDPSLREFLITHVWAVDLQEATEMTDAIRARLIASGEWDKAVERDRFYE